MSFLKNQDGTSMIIGAMLILMFTTLMYATVQVGIVPIWNAAVEIEHFDEVYSDMVRLKSDIMDVGIYKIPKSSSIHMGFRYPNRMIFFNPGVGVFGMLTIDNSAKIEVNYTVNASGKLYSYTRTYNSSRIIYDEYGIINSPKLVYEHGIIIRDFGTANITEDEQSLITSDNIYIPLVTGKSDSKSSMGTESLEIKPMETSTRRNIKYVNITMDTKYPGVWMDLLKNVSGANVSGSRIIINSTATQHIVFPSEISEEIYAGIITFSTEAIPELPPGFTNINPAKPNWPVITGIRIAATEGPGDYEKTHSTITATVKNVTAPYDIHADLNDLTKNPLIYDETPDYSSPNGTTEAVWKLPNSNDVHWSDISHPQYSEHEAVIVTFWVVNTENKMQFYTTRIFVRKSGTQWED